MLAAALALLLVVGLVAAPSEVRADTRSERERVRSQKAEVAGEVDALRADQSDVRSALADLEADLKSQEAAHSDAERALSQAEVELERLAVAQEAKEAEVAGLRDRIATLAVDAYINPPSGDTLEAFGADSASAAVRKRSLLDIRAGRDLDLLDELRAAQAELEDLKEDAADTAESARQRRSNVADRLSQLTGAQARQAAFVQDVDRRLDAKLGEAASLAAVDGELSKRIAAQEAEIAASVRRSNGYSSGGGSFTPPPSGSIPVTHVGGGIYVASSVASQTQAMMSAAAAAGISLGGHGYRDPNQQIALRRQNCGSSEFAIWQMSPSQCRPETARPGFSKHEQGLAIDFRGMRYGDAGYNWLSSNAGQYGYSNTVSGEPWHWSVGGG